MELLSRRCPLFSTYIEAHRRERHEQKRREYVVYSLVKYISNYTVKNFREEEAAKRLAEQEELSKKENEERLMIEQVRQEEAVKRQIQQALNQQTYEQFKKYAIQQYPGRFRFSKFNILILML